MFVQSLNKSLISIISLGDSTKPEDHLEVFKKFSPDSNLTFPMLTESPNDLQL